MITGTTITLPSGLWVGGVHHRQATLRPLTGEDEAFIAEAQGLWQPAECVTAVLGRCLTRLGSPSAEGEDPQALVRSLTMGDREALLLHLRRLTMGDALAGVLNCPKAGCGAPMDLDLRVSDLLLPPYPQPSPEYQAMVRENGSAWQVRFRLPTGQDQEDATRLIGHQTDSGASLLLKRCLLAVTAGEGKGEALPVDEDLPPGIAAAMPGLLAERDPQAEVQLDLVCPACDHHFSALFDAASYFFREVTSRSSYLYQQIHVLALYYHWSETEIMGMTTKRRLRYLSLLEETLGEAAGHD